MAAKLQGLLPGPMIDHGRDGKEGLLAGGAGTGAGAKVGICAGAGVLMVVIGGWEGAWVPKRLIEPGQT